MNARSIVLALALVATCGATPLVPLPSGTYTYAIKQDGKQTGTSTITIDHQASSVTVNESVAAAGETHKASRKLDSATFSTLSWTGISAVDGATNSVTMSATGATYRHGEDPAKQLVAPIAGGPAALFDLYVAEFVTLPAMLHATNATRYNDYCVCFDEFMTKAVSIAPATTARPAGALPGDTGIALTASGKTAVLWYDPATFLLREADFADQGLSYVRTGSAP